MKVNADHQPYSAHHQAYSRSGPAKGRIHLRVTALFCLLASVLLTFVGTAAPPALAQSAATARVDVLTINGTITNVSHAYIKRGMDQAHSDGASAILIELGSAGGDASAADAIVSSIANSDIPVIVYVPAGKTVLGAAVTILAAGHIAAMAPNATIGDASRVDGGKDVATSDAKATTQLRELATEHGRSTGWTGDATKNGLRLSGDQAKAEGIVDLVAPDRASLLTAVNGRALTLHSGEQVTLATANAESSVISMTAFEQFRAFITSPSVAYVLLCFGVLGIFLELASPGGFVAGTIGVICFATGIYAFNALPLNAAGFGLMLLAFVLLGIDLFVTSFGVLTLTGLASFIAGSYILIDTDIVGYDPVSRPVIWTATACVIGYSLFVGLSAVRSFRATPVTGRRAMIGEIGTVRDPLDPNGLVFVMGELWQARVPKTDHDQVVPVPVGTRVEITAINGLLLSVRPVAGNAARDEDGGSPLTRQIERIERADRNEPRGASVLPVRDGVESLRA
ncbi:MAG: NfeD family protein [Thermomicrobiales bacterium]